MNIAALLSSETKKAAGEQVARAKITDTVFHQSGTHFFVQPTGNRGIDHPQLPAGNYSVKFSLERGFFLELISEFPEMGKIYGDAQANAERILNTYLAKKGNLGVLLDGLKGSGKTLTARLISILGRKRGIPTLIINSALTGEAFFHFLYSIQQECIIFFDEFEKVYDDKEQESLLTVLDGTFPSKKLFLLTSNDKAKVNSHLKNRPGRIHYYLNFKGLSAEFIREYVGDNLKNKDHEKELLSICGMFSALNFDSLSTMIWEMNLYNEPAGKAISMLNTRPEAVTDTYSVSLELKGVNFKFEKEFLVNERFRGNPVSLPNSEYAIRVPAIPAAAAAIFEVSEEEAKALSPFAFEESLDLMNEHQKASDEGKKERINWNNHSYVDTFKYEGARSMPLLRVHADNDVVVKGVLITEAVRFSAADLVGIGLEDGSYTFKNKHDSVLTFTRIKAAEEKTPLDYLKYLA